MSQLLIFGAGDIARLACHYFSRDSEHGVVAFAVDASHRAADAFEGRPLIDWEDAPRRYPPDDFRVFVALSYARMNRTRAEKVAAARAAGYSLVSYVSSRCTYLADEPPGDNCFILEDNTIQPFVRIGENVTLWSGNHVGHDSVIGDHVFVSSHVVISGHVSIGPYCFLGVNATLRNGIALAPCTLVGAGAAVMQDTVEGGVYLPPRAMLHHKRSEDVRL
ncbi:MAG: acetyltransferase [Phycisphaerae bacterium]|nr:acetyltransferase [Phycisphaerae bacterium]NUQ44789.1 acetyltransferase [Phycisphaerae bacterium]